MRVDVNDMIHVHGEAMSNRHIFATSSQYQQSFFFTITCTKFTFIQIQKNSMQ